MDSLQGSGGCYRRERCDDKNDGNAEMTEMTADGRCDENVTPLDLWRNDRNDRNDKNDKNDGRSEL